MARSGEFERVPPLDHWDSLAVWRLIELKRALWHMEEGDERLEPWQERLAGLEALHDPIDRLLAEVEAQVNGVQGPLPDPSQLELFERGERTADTEVHQIRLADGHLFRGLGMKSCARCEITRGSRTRRCHTT